MRERRASSAETELSVDSGSSVRFVHPPSFPQFPKFGVGSERVPTKRRLEIIIRGSTGTCVVIVVTTLALLAISTADSAEASYRPAPSRIVAKAQKHRPPARGTLAKRAWIICHVWRGVSCRYALNVAWCENRGFYPRKRGPHDEYGNPRIGLWQFGTHERRVFGYGRNTWTQARAGYRYYRYAKLHHWRNGWGPWQCRPY